MAPFARLIYHGEVSMHLISVNVGRPRTIQTAKRTEETGIYKEPVAGPVAIGPLGLAGDAVVDTQNHGGPDQAVYVYGTGDYAWWAQALGRELAPGTFGENLTVGELESADLHAGDLLRVGQVVLQITAPRIPCATLAARMGDPAFVRRYREAERPGLYCRVLTPGAVEAGDAVAVEPYAGPTLSLREMFRAYYRKGEQDEASIRRHLAAPIAVRARVEQEERLRVLLG